MRLLSCPKTTYRLPISAFLPLPHRCCVARGDHRLDSAANIEIPDDFHRSRFARGREIVENPIDRALVKNPVVAKAPQIQLETLELETEFRWHVHDANRAEVWSPTLELPQLFSVRFDASNGAERSKLA